MTRQSPLIANNRLELSADGLWQLPGTTTGEFAYSDGDSEEEYVRQVIESAGDTSSTSAELEQYIRDWPSEYHLTSQRANLLRALDLQGLDNVLELGCGCGAISRYLGEQGLVVDAIEGSRRRARIARSRCRELTGVTIVNTNFNDVALPADSYDAVFLVGVLEYAKRFFPDAGDDRSAVLQILDAVTASLKADGVVVIAIENRLGLKYLLGASEDHYGVPFIGVHRYPESAGIRTYDQGEWKLLLAEAGLDEDIFLAPFPDYKIPSVVLHEDFLASASAGVHLRGVRSRDYLHALNSDLDEALFWQAAGQNGTLLEYANSFLIVAGRAGPRASQLAAFDFCHFTGPHRRPGFRTMSRKPRGAAQVHKVRLSGTAADDDRLRQVCESEPYLAGELLDQQWRQNLMTWQDPDRLLALYREYYHFLKAYPAPTGGWTDIIDVLPFNIVVAMDGSLLPFDREWRVQDDLSIDFVLFRALFWFVYANGRYFKGLFDKAAHGTIRDYLFGTMSALGADAGSIDEFAEQEDRFQQAIGIDQHGITRRLLDSSPGSSGQTTFHPCLYWAAPGECLAEERRLTATAALGSSRQQVVFVLPQSLPAGSRLRFDPAEQEGYFHIYALRIEALDDQGVVRRTLLSYPGAAELARVAKLQDVVLHGSGGRAVFVALSNDPALELTLDEDIDRARLVVEMDWPHSEEYAVVRAGLKHLHDEWQWEKRQLETRLAELEADSRQLAEIRASRSFRLLSAMRRRAD